MKQPQAQSLICGPLKVWLSENRRGCCIAETNASTICLFLWCNFVPVCLLYLCRDVRGALSFSTFSFRALTV